MSCVLVRVEEIGGAWVDNCLKQTVLHSSEARYVLENVGSILKINSH